MQVAEWADIEMTGRLPEAVERHLRHTRILRPGESPEALIALLARNRDEWLAVAAEGRRKGLPWARLLDSVPYPSQPRSQPCPRLTPIPACWASGSPRPARPVGRRRRRSPNSSGTAARPISPSRRETRTARPDEIIKLATYFGRKVDELVRPGEPVTDLQPHLRAVADKMRTGDQSQVALNAAIDKLQALAEDYRELERIRNDPLQPEPPARGDAQPEDLSHLAGRGGRRTGAEATRARRPAGNLPPKDAGMGDCRPADLLHLTTSPRTSPGCTPTRRQLGICILINRKQPLERRRVFMLQEYGHFLLGTDRYKPGIDYLVISRCKPANERFAEAFALSFLMPASSVREQFQKILAHRIRRLSGRRPVPDEALLLRLAGGDDVAGGAVGGADPQGLPGKHRNELGSPPARPTPCLA